MFFFSLFTSCKKDVIQTDFELGKKEWLAFKRSSNNNYSYTITGSSWTGFSDSTIIFVNYRIVSGWKYIAYTTDGKTGQKTLRDSWTESDTELNTHQFGASPLNLDAIYDKAAKEWLKVDTKLNNIYFEAKNQGMISNCGYVQTGCQDDCFIGIRISNISPSLSIKL